VKSIDAQQHKQENFAAFPHLSLSRFDEWLLRKIHRSIGRPPIRLQAAGGVEVLPSQARPVATIAIRDRKTLLDLVLDPEVGFGDAYSKGRISVEGDLIAALESVDRRTSEPVAKSWYTQIVQRCVGFVQRNSLRGARNNIHRHYDLNNDFFRLWLDPQMVYSCAYFPAGTSRLDEAQVAKMDYICRKLNLQPGERVVDIGSGWGALALHMAKYYGVTVRGFSISREQICWARRRAQEMNLTHRVEFIEDDYRNIGEKCDALVSVGMLEHVGAGHYAEMGRILNRSIDRAGRGLIQTIGRNWPRPFSNWVSKRIFPGAYAPTLAQMMDMFEPWDFSVVDVENLRLHYARTLQHWLERFDQASSQVTAMFGPEFVRAWRLYLASSISGFDVGTLQLFQVVFARTACQQIPATRAHLYREKQLLAAEAPTQPTMQLATYLMNAESIQNLAQTIAAKHNMRRRAGDAKSQPAQD
jgi:cyclopropane-fatty-acyl-phospholipid synthase